MRKLWILPLLALFVLSACSGDSNDQQTDEDINAPQVIVYRSPT